jgi:hypothetical protein
MKSVVMAATLGQSTSVSSSCKPAHFAVVLVPVNHTRSLLQRQWRCAMKEYERSQGLMTEDPRLPSAHCRLAAFR